MPNDELTNVERSALIVLMAEAREVSNAELRNTHGVNLSVANRAKLNDRKLVTTTKDGRRLIHELTDAGWVRVEQEFGAEPPARAGALGGALYAVLAGLQRHHQRADQRPNDTFLPPAAPETDRAGVDDRVRALYGQLAVEPGAWVRLADLRPLLADVTRTDLDAALVRLNRTEDVRLIPEENAKTLRPVDRKAAVSVGGQDAHLMAIGVR